MKLLFVHGWGFDAGLWAGVASLLPDARIGVADRGYFGAPRTPELEGPTIAVAHSFGAMLVLRDPPPDCAGLIAINGFDCFTAREGFAGVAPRVLDRMLARFDGDTRAVLEEFRARCGDATPMPACDAEILRQDLVTLRDGDCRTEAAAWVRPLLVLHGGQDPILPAAMRDQAFAGARGAERATHPDAGHLLPQSHAAFCAQHIAAFARRLA